MTAFDIAAGLVVLVSALVGLSRGAVRELVAFFAFTLAAAAAVFLLPFSAPIARHSVHPAWASKAAAILVVFLAAYVGLRLLGAAVSSTLHRQAALGALDRSAGAGLGVVRGLVALGAFYLVFTAATPQDLAPQWITGARLYPLSRLSGRALAAIAPEGVRGMGGISRVLKDRLADDSANANPASVQTPPADAAANPYAGVDEARVHRRRTLIVRSDTDQAR